MKQELLEQLTRDGYMHIREIPGRGICGTYRFMFTTGLCYGIDDTGYAGRWCYETSGEAFGALEKWDGKDDPPGDWIKYKGKGGEYSHIQKHNEQIKREYPIQDDIWPSRRWNADRTEYEDMSGGEWDW